MAETSVLIYPWDVAQEGPQAIIDTLAEMGVTRLQIATAYHSAEVITPRRTSAVVTVAQANTVHLPLPRKSFSDLSIPMSRIATEYPDLYPQLKAATDKAGIALSGWAIGFHNTSLASENPDCAIVSCFGDRFTHGLCPSNPRARTFAIELFGSISATGLFDRLLAESLSYLLYSHGHAHELWGARLDPNTRYLLSLCFCEHCLANGRKRGIDVEGLRKQVARELTRTWNADFRSGRVPDDGAEMTSLHFVWQDLAEYTRMRMETVSTLVQEVCDQVHRHGVELDLSAAVWGRPAFTNWTEGVDVAESVRIADGFVLECYYPTAGEVARELDHAQAIHSRVGPEAATLTAALALWPSFHGTRDDFLSKVRAISGSGIDRLALYNYGTATQSTLAWVAEAVAEMKTGGRP